jgi:hypothetical protein
LRGRTTRADPRRALAQTGIIDAPSASPSVSYRPSPGAEGSLSWLQGRRSGSETAVAPGASGAKCWPSIKAQPSRCQIALAARPGVALRCVPAVDCFPDREAFVQDRDDVPRLAGFPNDPCPLGGSDQRYPTAVCPDDDDPTSRSFGRGLERLDPLPSREA